MVAPIAGLPSGPSAAACRPSRALLCQLIYTRSLSHFAIIPTTCFLGFTASPRDKVLSRSPAPMTAVGPITVRISDPVAGGESQPGVSGIYRNKASAEALPETYNGCATLYELFNKAVEEHGDNR